MLRLSLLRILDLDGPQSLQCYHRSVVSLVCKCLELQAKELPSSLKCLLVEVVGFPVLPNLSSLVQSVWKTSNYCILVCE